MLSPQPSPATQAWEGSSARRDPEALGQEGPVRAPSMVSTPGCARGPGDAEAEGWGAWTPGHVLPTIHRAWDTSINLGIIFIIPLIEKVPSFPSLFVEMRAC